MGGGSWPVRFAEYVPLASQSPYLIILYSVANYKPHLSPFWQIGNFRDPNLATFYFYELTHFLSWMKNTLLFIYSTNILVILFTVIMKNCLTPQNPEMCDPILVTLLKMRPHYSQSSRENATPSSGSFPLVSYKEVPPIPRKRKFLHKSDREAFRLAYEWKLQFVVASSLRTESQYTVEPPYGHLSTTDNFWQKIHTLTLV